MTRKRRVLFDRGCQLAGSMQIGKFSEEVCFVFLGAEHSQDLWGWRDGFWDEGRSQTRAPFALTSRQAIVKRLKEERMGFDNQLAGIERTLKASQFLPFNNFHDHSMVHRFCLSKKMATWLCGPLGQAKERDYEELLLLSHDAYHAKEPSASSPLDKEFYLILRSQHVKLHSFLFGLRHIKNPLWIDKNTKSQTGSRPGSSSQTAQHHFFTFSRQPNTAKLLSKTLQGDGAGRVRISEFCSRFPVETDGWWRVQICSTPKVLGPKSRSSLIYIRFFSIEHLRKNPIMHVYTH